MLNESDTEETKIDCIQHRSTEGCDFVKDDWYVDMLQLIADGSLPDQDDSLYDDEPLYQIYHQSAVVRDVISQNAASDNEHGWKLH